MATQFKVYNNTSGSDLIYDFKGISKNQVANVFLKMWSEVQEDVKNKILNTLTEDNTEVQLVILKW